PPLADAPCVVVFALATSPPRLGAGAALLRDLRRRTGTGQAPARLVAFSPLTGLRARVIGLVDDEEAWREHVASRPGLAGPEALREQLLDLLARDTLPDFVPEAAQSWLAAEAREFARSPTYVVGNFHRSMGA